VTLDGACRARPTLACQVIRRGADAAAAQEHRAAARRAPTGLCDADSSSGRNSAPSSAARAQTRVRSPWTGAVLALPDNSSSPMMSSLIIVMPRQRLCFVLDVMVSSWFCHGRNDATNRSVQYRYRSRHWLALARATASGGRIVQHIPLDTLLGIERQKLAAIAIPAIRAARPANHMLLTARAAPASPRWSSLCDHSARRVCGSWKCLLTTCRPAGHCRPAALAARAIHSSMLIDFSVAANDPH